MTALRSVETLYFTPFLSRIFVTLRKRLRQKNYQGMQIEELLGHCELPWGNEVKVDVVMGKELRERMHCATILRRKRVN